MINLNAFKTNSYFSQCKSAQTPYEYENKAVFYCLQVQEACHTKSKSLFKLNFH